MVPLLAMMDTNWTPVSLHYNLTILHIFHISGPLCGESTGYQWIPNSKGQ